MARTKDFDESEVLKKAVCIFWDKGYNGTSMQELVDGLGISRSSMYDTFGDKRELYLKALQSYQEGYGTQLCSLINSGKPVKEVAKQILQNVVNDLLGDKQIKGCFMVNAGIELGSHDAEVKELINSTEVQLEEAFLKLIKQGQVSGELAKDKDAQALARFLGNTVKGMQVSVKSTTDPAFFEDVIQTALSVLN